MTVAVFGPDYAAAYDALYQDKDYPAECDVIEHVFRMYGNGPVRRVLDLGCGTGGHVALLAERGYGLVGVDRSPSMLDLARERVGEHARLELGDLTSVDLGETFDAVLMMFGVLSYQLANTDVQAALATARRHLSAGGLFFSDVWYGPAVLAQRPADRLKVLELGNGQLIRAASGELDSARQACTVRYHLWRIEDGRLVSDTREQHRMRYFFPLELELLLGQAGFALERLGGFPDVDAPADEDTWNAAVVARAL